jgi:hypothetical protein
MLIIPPFLIAFFGLGMGAPFALGKYLAVALAGIWLALGQTYRKAYQWPLAYLVVAVITTIGSTDIWTSIWGLWGTYTTGLLAALVLIPFYACVSSDDRPALELGLRLGAYVLIAGAVLQCAGYFDKYLSSMGGRLYSTMGSPIYLGAVIALCFPFVGKWEKGALLVLLIATRSRGAWLAVAAGIFYENSYRLTRRQIIWSCVSVSVLFVAALHMRPGSDIGRVLVWDAAVQAFKQKPWLGWGYGNFYTVAAVLRNPTWEEIYGSTTQDHAHNIFLESLSCSGVIGLAALCGMLYHFFSCADRTARSALIGFGIVALLEPMSQVAKAIALMICASCQKPEISFSKSEGRGVKGFSLLCLALIFLLAHWDQIFYRYAKYPWSVSSKNAEIYAGLLRPIFSRQQFKF